MWQTPRDSDVAEREQDVPGPGLVILFSGGVPKLVPYAVDGEGIVVGRELADAGDDRISRSHARVRVSDAAFAVSDLGSRNGTWVGGARIADEQWVHPPAIVRTGRTIAMLVRDVRGFEGAAVRADQGAVIGPTFARALAMVERAGRTGDTLLVTGESGTGKEIAARAFHAATDRAGPLIAVNCAAIPAGVAERLLFGTRRGAYSGAERDAEGYLAAADGGTIFFDEIGELDRDVQGKLLRVLESRELMPLGASRPQRIDIRIVVATLRDLRDEVVAKRFREDLYYRIGRPEVRLPPLRERLEEIPWLIAHAVERATPGATVHPSLVEACLLRAWPGNVRELLAEARRAALIAREAGRREVRLEDLSANAGAAIVAPTPAPAPRRRGELPDPDEIARALDAAAGNVTRAARALGLHRNQLRRYLSRKPDDE